jgi:tRNA (adenine37-N6)-methyltransferase
MLDRSANGLLPQEMKLDRIGVVRSCFGDKFAVPRQPGLCPSAWGELVFDPSFRSAEAVRGLEGFSHVWLVFGFHLTAGDGWHPTVRPPRLGGNERVGVFASRSPFRPNSLGLSVVRLEGIELQGADGPVLLLGGIDLTDGTPVFDVKPYVPYCDAVPDARGGFAVAAPELLDVVVADEVAAAFAELSPRAQAVIRECLAQDPRPAVHGDQPGRTYGALLCGRDVKFQISGRRCTIVAL